MDISCCWGGDLSAVLRGKVTVVGGRVCRVPGFAQIADHLTQNSPFCRFSARWSALWAARSLMRVTRAGDAPIRCFSCHHDPNHADTGYHRARECSSSAQRWPGPKLIPRGHSANSEWSTRPCAGLTSSDATRQHHVSNSLNLLIGAWARLPAYGIAGLRADERAQLRNSGPACGREDPASE